VETHEGVSDSTDNLRLTLENMKIQQLQNVLAKLKAEFPAIKKRRETAEHYATLARKPLDRHNAKIEQVMAEIFKLENPYLKGDRVYVLDCKGTVRIGEFMDYIVPGHDDYFGYGPCRLRVLYVSGGYVRHEKFEANQVYRVPPKGLVAEKSAKTKIPTKA